MAIEIIPKPKIKKISWINIVLYSYLAIFLVLFLSYFIFDHYQKKLNQEFSDLEKSLLRTPAEKELEEEIIGYQRKLKDFTSLLNYHRLPLNIFNFLEKVTHPKVWFSELDLNLTKNTIDLSGQADTSEVMAQQLLILRKEELIQNLNLSKLSRNKEGRLEFSLQVEILESGISNYK